MLNLTDVERRILINQSRILAALYPLESTDFERTVEILAEGYHEGWQDVVLKGLKAPFLKEELNFVYQVLDMYDWVQKSYYALLIDEKLHLREQNLVFPGFEPKSEARYLIYARFLLENLDRFSFTEVVKPLAAQRPMHGIYKALLRELPDNGEVLSAGQLKAFARAIEGGAALARSA